MPWHAPAFRAPSPFVLSLHSGKRGSIMGSDILRQKIGLRVATLNDMWGNKEQLPAIFLDHRSLSE